MSSNLTLWSIYVFIFIKCIIDWVFRTGTGFAYPLVPLWIEFWTFQKVVCWCALGMMGNHLAAAKSLQSCPTLCDPIERQPTRLPRPWGSPGKNTEVGCHFLLQCMKVKSESEVVQSCPTLSDPVDCSLPGSSVHGVFQARVLEWGAIAFSDVIHICFFKGMGDTWIRT